MKYLLSSAVFMLMVSIGMSLNCAQLAGNWRRLTPTIWGKLLLATFIVPPLLVMAIGHILPFGRAATAGLYLIAVSPGAPLMTRGVAKRGFDMQMAASYQVWGALMIPIMIPLLVAAAGWFYGREIWIPPMQLLAVIGKQQFAPLLTGAVLMHLAPGFSTKVRHALNLLGNVVLTAALIALLFKMGPALKAVSPWVAIAAILLAVGCMAAGRLLLTSRTTAVQTLAISNVNRHVGLAVLLSGQHIHDPRTLPAIAAYALAAPPVMFFYAKFVPHQEKKGVS